MAASASLLAKDTTASATAFLISSRVLVIYLLESAVHKLEYKYYSIFLKAEGVRRFFRYFSRSLVVFHTILSPEAEHVRALPDIVFWEGFCVPRDGDDEEESPSPVEKGEGARLAGKGSHCRCETYPPSIRTVSLPFQERTKQYIILCSPSGRTTMVQW